MKNGNFESTFINSDIFIPNYFSRNYYLYIVFNKTDAT